MTVPAARVASAAPRLDAAALHRLLVVTVLGFASGLPLALTGQAMQAWLSVEGVDIATIGFLSLVGLPYTFKFLWAPLMDRFELPWLGRRRGWLVLTQLALAGALLLLAATPPSRRDRAAFALLALRWWPSCRRRRTSSSTPTAPTCCRRRARPRLVAERARLPAGDDPLGRRRADLDRPRAGRRLDLAARSTASMAWLMVGAAVLSALALPRLAPLPTAAQRGAQRRGRLPRGARRGRRRLRRSRDRFGRAIARALLSPLLARSTLDAGRCRRAGSTWSTLLLGIAFTLPLAAWAARRRAASRRCSAACRSYFAQPGAAAFLAFIVLYKLGDAFAGSLMTPFLLQAMAYSSGRGRRRQQDHRPVADDRRRAARRRADAQARPVARADAVRRAADGQQPRLLVAGGRTGKGLLPGLTIPAFDWGFVELAQADAGRRRPADGDRLSRTCPAAWARRPSSRS